MPLRERAGLEISGAVNALYAIDYATNLAQHNSWRSLSNLTLSASPYLVPGTAPSTAGCRFYRPLAVPPPTNLTSMVFIPPGVFTMGSPLSDPDRHDDELPQTMVTLS